MELLGAGLTAGSTLGGLWFIVRLITHYQRDFTDRYAGELSSTRTRVEELERRLDEAEVEKAAVAADRDLYRRQLFEASAERAAMRQLLAQHSIPWVWQPLDWDGPGDGG